MGADIMLLGIAAAGALVIVAAIEIAALFLCICYQRVAKVFG